MPTSIELPQPFNEKALNEKPFGFSPSNRWNRALLFIGLWTLIGVSFASQFYISSWKLGRPVSWTYALSYSLWDWYVFALLSAPVLALARRFRLERGRWRNLAAHLAGSVIFSGAYLVLRSLAAQLQGWWAGQPVDFSQAFQPLMVKAVHFTFLVYWVIVAVRHAFDYYQQAQEKELRALELEQHLTQARLQALQMQLNPHFLFNTLHAISSLMHRDVEAADRMIARLSDLLRYALESTDAQEATLRQELDFLNQYLEIEQTRFGDRLQVDRQIADDAWDARVPNLILQPLVENAIRHGLEPQARPGKIELRAWRDAADLHLEVSDNGGGLSDSAEEGVGLANTRSRLRQLYGNHQRLDLINRPEGGVSVRVTFPFRRQQ